MSESKNLVNVTDSNFEQEVLQSDQVSLVDFWAEWCSPCKMLAPTVEAIADEYAGKVKVCKMDVDNNPNTPSQYGVRGIPTLIVVKNGQVVDQVTGNQPKESIAELLDKHL